MLLTLEDASGPFPDTATASPLCHSPVRRGSHSPVFSDAAEVSFCFFSLQMFSFWSFSCFTAPPPEGMFQGRNKIKIQTNQLLCVGHSRCAAFGHRSAGLSYILLPQTHTPRPLLPLCERFQQVLRKSSGHNRKLLYGSSKNVLQAHPLEINWYRVHSVSS